MSARTIALEALKYAYNESDSDFIRDLQIGPAIAALEAEIAQAEPTNEELERLWETTHAGHPADFAADVLERWGGWPAGVLGYGGSLNTTPSAEIAQEVEPVAWLYESGTIGGYDYLLTRTREVEGNYAESAMWHESPLFAAPQAVNAELCKSLQRLVIEITLSDVDPKYIESHFRVHIDNARAAIAKAEGAKP